MMSSNSDSDDLQASSTKLVSHKTCVWCKGFKQLLPTKPYCSDCCGKMYRECSRCHIPYPEAKFFVENERRCNACQKKLQKERQRRMQQKMQQQQQQQQPTIQQSSSFSSSSPCDGVTAKPEKRKADGFDTIVIPEDEEDHDDVNDDLKMAVRLFRRWKKKTKKEDASAILIF
jgi:hypothetical protein